MKIISTFVHGYNDLSINLPDIAKPSLLVINNSKQKVYSYIFPRNPDDFKKYKIKTECVGDHHTGSSSCKDKYFMFGQYFNKGGWYTEEIITTDHKGLDLKKLKLIKTKIACLPPMNSARLSNFFIFLETL